MKYEKPNVPNVVKLSSFLKTLPRHKFSMGGWGNQSLHGPLHQFENKSSGCIATWAVFLFAPHLLPFTEISGVAARALGLTHREAKYLFLGLFSPKPLGEITLEEAVGELENVVSVVLTDP